MSANYAPNDTTPRDPRNPAQKYYSGITSMTLAVVSMFILTWALAPAALVFGIVAVVNGNKLDNPKLRGEGWIGTVVASLILIGWFLIASLS